MALFGLFKSREQRELDLQIRFRQGKSRVSRYVQQARKAAEKYWQLAEQSHRLGDVDQFQQLAAGFVKTRESINRWERYLIKLDALELQRNEVASTGEFLKSVQAMTRSIMTGVSPEQVAHMQGQLESAILRTESVEQGLDMAIDATGESLVGISDMSDEALAAAVASMESQFRASDSATDPKHRKPVLSGCAPA